MRTAAIAALALLIAAVAAAPPAGAATVTAVSAGNDQACALLSDTTVKCWGPNSRGQLGDGTHTWRLTAVAVRGLSGATAVSAGGQSSCALLADGTVRCWGDNEDGQLGDGTTTNRSTPVAVVGLTGVVAVSAGDAFACAVRMDHSVACWGDNARGELGNGTRTSSPTPVSVPGLTDVTAINADDQHACALHADGRVSCWGWSGLLGPVDQAGDMLTPTFVPNLSDAVSLGGSLSFGSCAVTSQGAAKCWEPGKSPTVVAGFEDHLASFGYTYDGQQTEHKCALIVGGTVRCQSDNPYAGQVGIGRTKTTQPVTVTGLSGVTAISLNSFYTCAVLSGGIKCWGDNSGGQLGDGTTTTRFRPVSVLGINGPPPPVFMQTSGCATKAGGPFNRPVWAQHPRRFGGSCDGIVQVTGVRWRHWGDPVARATATIAVATCRPNCADSPRRRYRATFVATDIKRCGKRRVYGTITGRYASGPNFGDVPLQGCL